MIKLPTITPSDIQTVPQAQTVIGQLLSIIEELLKQVQQLSNDNQALQQEVARLQKQSKPPQQNASANTKASQDYSSRKQTKEKGVWHKRVKREMITIDREEQLPEVPQCQCGSMQFRIIRTWNKIVQGLLIKRDTVQYNGVDKQCAKCGHVYSSTIPDEIKGKEFSSELRSWASIFKFDYRMSEGLIWRFFTGVEIVISKGQITNILLENSEKLSGSYTHVRVWGLKLSNYLHSDATAVMRQHLCEDLFQVEK